MSRKMDHAATRPFPPRPAPGRESVPMPVPHNAPRTPAPHPSAMHAAAHPTTRCAQPDPRYPQMEAMHLTI